MVDAGMKQGFGGVVLGVIMLLVAFNVSGTTVNTSAFGLYDDLQAQEQTSTNISYDNESHALLADGETSGTWTSVKENVSSYNETKLDVYVQELNSNNSADATVTGYDSSGTQTGSKTVTLAEGKNAVDLESGLGDPAEVELQVSLDRDATSDSSPELTGYEGFKEGQTPYLKWVVAIFGVAVMLFSIRNL